MKSLIMTAALMVTANVMAADKVDYTYCQENFNKAAPMGMGFEEGFPFKITDDGKAWVHLKVKSYKKDEKTGTETFEYGEKPFKTKVTISRDEKGELARVVSSTFYDAPEFKRGVGAKKDLYGGMGGMYGGMGLGGMGMGMMGGNPFPSVDTTTDVVTDIKIQNGKCVPSRSVMETKAGKSSEKHFITDLQLCRDVKTFFKKNPDAAACFGSKMNEAMEAVLQGHRTRNADLYKTEASSEEEQTQASGYPGIGTWGGFNSEGMSYNGINGGYGIFIDNLATEKGTPNLLGSPLARGATVLTYCEMPFGPMSKMMQDEVLFAPELAKDSSKDQTAVSK